MITAIISALGGVAIGVIGAIARARYQKRQQEFEIERLRKLDEYLKLRDAQKDLPPNPY